MKYVVTSMNTKLDEVIFHLKEIKLETQLNGKKGKQL
tara:strand:+ start:185 stop:295 length:111 start_codon:yes stop_codon:yes gene_type:complete